MGVTCEKHSLCKYGLRSRQTIVSVVWTVERAFPKQQVIYFLYSPEVTWIDIKMSIMCSLVILQLNQFWNEMKLNPSVADARRCVINSQYFHDISTESLSHSHVVSYLIRRVPVRRSLSHRFFTLFSQRFSKWFLGTILGINGNFIRLCWWSNNEFPQCSILFKRCL